MFGLGERKALGETRASPARAAEPNKRQKVKRITVVDDAAKPSEEFVPLPESSADEGQGDPTFMISLAGVPRAPDVEAIPMAKRVFMTPPELGGFTPRGRGRGRGAPFRGRGAPFRGRGAPRGGGPAGNSRFTWVRPSSPESSSTAATTTSNATPAAEATPAAPAPGPKPSGPSKQTPPTSGGDVDALFEKAAEKEFYEDGFYDGTSGGPTYEEINSIRGGRGGYRGRGWSRGRGWASRGRGWAPRGRGGYNSWQAY